MGKRKAVNTNPYDLFLQTSWEKTDKKGDYSEFTKTCEVKWREMTDNEKKEYNKMSAEGKESQAPTQKKARKAAKKEKDPNKPKRPPSSYLLFCEAFREEVKTSNPGVSVTEIIKLLSARWNALPLSDKQIYIDKANEEKKKYQELLKNGNSKEE